MEKIIKNLEVFYEEFKKYLTANVSSSVNFEDFVKEFKFGESIEKEQVHWTDKDGKEHWKIFDPWVRVDLQTKEEIGLLLRLPYWEYTSEYRPHYEIYEKLKKMCADYSQKKPSFSLTEKSDKEKNKIIWWIGGGVLFILFVSLLVYLFRRKRKIKK